ncbi:hypothetical protein ANO11243_072360 [Dothideomycetidae sp. 11243]|nr:hypothetical protein ANO11243_072360 [fungal sp. No.11243]
MATISIESSTTSLDTRPTRQEHHHHHHRARPASLERLANAPPISLITTDAPEADALATRLVTAPLRFTAFLISLSWVDWRARPGSDSWSGRAATQWHEPEVAYAQCPKGRWIVRHDTVGKDDRRMEVSDAFAQWGRVEALLVVLGLAFVAAVAWLLREAWAWIK